MMNRCSVTSVVKRMPCIVVFCVYSMNKAFQSAVSSWSWFGLFLRGGRGVCIVRRRDSGRRDSGRCDPGRRDSGRFDSGRGSGRCDPGRRDSGRGLLFRGGIKSF